MPDNSALTMSEAMGKTGPALSATSDMPEPAPAPEPAPEPKPEPQPGPTPEPKPDDADAKSSSTERTRRLAAESRADAATDALNRALSIIEKFGANNPIATTIKTEAAKDPQPDRTKYDDPDKYHADLVGWAMREGTRQAKAEMEVERTEREQKETATRTQTEWAAKREKFIEAHPDYAEVAERDDLKITTSMAQAIVNSDNGPALAYHLGKNPSEAARIAALTNAVQQVMELGKLAVKIASTTTETSKAPPPITPVNSRSRATPKTPAEESMDEYAARRLPQLQSERRNFFGKPAGAPTH